MESKLNASDPEPFHHFGEAVAVSGDVAVVGARLDGHAGTYSGAAYVYERIEAMPGAWGAIRKLVASDAVAGDQFGFSVAIDGDTLAVSAPSGAVYVYERNLGGPSQWGEVKKLVPSDGALGINFGFSLSIRGGVLVVGTQSGSGEDPGSAYVYERDAGGPGNWGAVGVLVPSDSAARDGFGHSVSNDDGTIVVGALGVPGSSPGAAYVYRRQADGAENWEEVKKLIASDTPSVSNGFGMSVSISGDTLLVGARIAPPDFSGAAYVFERDHGGVGNWGEVKKITAADGMTSDRFGHAVAIDGDTVVVGASHDDVGGEFHVGSAYVYRRDWGGSNEWGEVAHLFASDGGGGDNFGYAVAMSGRVALVGAPFDDGFGVSAGLAYVYQDDRCGNGDVDEGEDCDGSACCTSTCEFALEGTACDDGTVCTVLDVCDEAGECRSGAAAQTCIGGFGKATVLVAENKMGKERLLLEMKNGPAILPIDFGDPGAGSTEYSLCIFDDQDVLVGELAVARPGDMDCAGRDCWKAAAFGWRYRDKAASADGVTRMRMRGGSAGQSQIRVQAANNAKKGRVQMPLRIAAALQSSANATLQLVPSDAPCFEAVVDEVRKAESDIFKATR